MHKLLAIILLSMLCLCLGADSISLLAQSTTASSTTALLQSYAIPNTLINSLTLTKLNYSGGTYILAYNGTNPAFLINSTGGKYSIVINITRISTIISATILQKNTAAINSTYLKNAMKTYNSSSSSVVSDCAVQVGLTSGETCTLANNCQSCLSAPNCAANLVGNPRRGVSGAGFGSPFEYDLITFTEQYNDLNSNLTAYYSNTKLNSSNPQAGIALLVSAFDNISSITQAMYQDLIFTPQANYDYSQCPTDGVGGPSYCYTTPICQELSYNLTLLGNMQAYISQFSSLPTSAQVAASINANENIYVAPLLTKAKLDEATAIISATLPGYNATIAGTSLLLSHIKSAALQTNLERIQANYSILTTQYVSANLTALNKTLLTQYSALKTLYFGLNKTYTSAVTLASNNTVILVELQSGNPNPSPQLTALSFQQAGLNSQLSGSVSNISATTAKLRTVNEETKSLSSNPSFTQSIARTIDAPISHAILSAIVPSYSGALALAPIVSLILPLIIGLILLGVLFWLYKNLSKKNRIIHNAKTRHNWRILFIIAGVLVVLLVIATYFVVSAASQSAPISSFISAVHSSKSVVIAINGTNNTAMITCSNKIKAALVAIGKSTQTITMSGIACNNGMPLETVDKCLAYYAQNNIPVVILTNSSLDTVSAYSYYGSILNVNGNPGFMSTCIASTMIR